MDEINEERKKRRGPTPVDDPRIHSVNVRLNDVELALLDGKRGSMAKAEWLRCAAIDKLPTLIPAINRETHADLAKVGVNLNQIARQLNIDPTGKSWEEIIALLKSVRNALLGVKL